MKGERNEYLKTARLILKFSKTHQVVDPMIRFFNVPVEHGAIRLETDFMCGSMNVQPSMGVRFVLAKLIPNLRMKNLRATAGHTPQTCLTHIFQNPSDRLLGLKLKPIDLDRRPSLEVNLRVGFLQNLDNVSVPFIGTLMVQASHNMHFRAPVLCRFPPSIEHLLIAHGVAFWIPQVTAECTKATSINANVSWV